MTDKILMSAYTPPLMLRTAPHSSHSKCHISHTEFIISQLHVSVRDSSINPPSKSGFWVWYLIHPSLFPHSSQLAHNPINCFSKWTWNLSILTFTSPILIVSTAIFHVDYYPGLWTVLLSPHFWFPSILFRKQQEPPFNLTMLFSYLQHFNCSSSLLRTESEHKIAVKNMWLLGVFVLFFIWA